MKYPNVLLSIILVFQMVILGQMVSEIEKFTTEDTLQEYLILDTSFSNSFKYNRMRKRVKRKGGTLKKSHQTILKTRKLLL